MKGIYALVSGFAGALTLTGLHYFFKKYNPDAPKVDILGMEAIIKSAGKAGVEPPHGKALFRLSIAGDIIFNTLYYSIVAAGKRPLISGSLLGLGTGVGTVTLPGLLGLSKDFTAKNIQTKLITLLIYLTGGLMAGGVYRNIESANAV
ncbi:MAG: hypothetical protein K2X86_13810 [Cytophagaceae bacterium]|nr:hypothetical protein [Cytophagaceae bacterium]